MGKTQCANIRDCLYNYKNTKKPDPSMSKATQDKLRKQCPQTLKKGQNDSSVFLMDKKGDDYKYSNTYYNNVLSHNSVLKVDQELLNNYNTTQLTLEYAGKIEYFRREFALSISRIGGLKVLTGKQGEIRLNCCFTNKNNPYIH